MATAYESAAQTADEAIFPGAPGARLVGFSCREAAATAAAAAFVIRRGRSAGGKALVYVNLAADESVRDWFGGDGLACPEGLAIDRESGTSEVVVYIEGPSSRE